ncbi:cyclic nucleotide-gated channel alpha-3-like [Ptychodera flava]|uniref:cyclic nucleotide-gated channel alpha-3-like n=1 Tax=Ptychodera flava TaxID=63121 RepID=UPI00396A8A27
MADTDDDFGDSDLQLWREESNISEKGNNVVQSGLKKMAKDFITSIKPNNAVQPSNEEITLTETSVPSHDSDRPTSGERDSRASTAITRSRSQAFSEFTSEVSILNEENHDAVAADDAEITLESDIFTSEQKSRSSGPLSFSYLCGGETGNGLSFNPEESSFLFFWYTVVTIATVYHLWTIIVRGTFIELNEKFFAIWLFFDYTFDAIYITDVVVALRTCYIDRGVMVKDVRQLARRYVHTWPFILDILSLLPLDLFYLIIGVNPLLRTNRLCKLYRVVKFRRMIEIRTPFPNFWRMANVVHTVLVVIHYNACFYYLISKYQDFSQESNSWAYPDPALYSDYAALSRKYLYSAYWSTLSLMTVSSLPAPENNQQFMYSIFQFILGLFLVAFVIAQVTNIVVIGNQSQMEYERVLHRTKSFMQHRKVPRETQLKVQRFYDYVWSSGQFHILDDAKVIRPLPTQMKTELALNANIVALEKVPLFKDCESALLRDLVLKLQYRMYSPGDYVCRNGDIGREMFIVSVGKLDIISQSEEEEEVRNISEGAIFGEISVVNLNRGTRRSVDVVSVGYSELFILTNSDVIETLQDYPRAREIISQQSRRRLQDQLNRAESFADSGTGFSRRGSSVTYRDPLTGYRSSKASLARKRKISFTGSQQSRDSGFMSSPGQSLLSSESRMMSPMAEEVTSDLTDRLQSVYEQNTRALKSSLDYVLENEVKYLRQRLHDTEQERDCRQREISQLKNQLIRQQQQDERFDDGRQCTIQRQNSSEAISKSQCSISDVEDVEC